MTDNIKKSLKQRSKLTKMYYKNSPKNSHHIKVVEISEECTSLISEAKNNFILKMTSKLEDSNTASKTYWSILNRFLYNKKIPAIPPLLVDGTFISDFCEKANLFNNEAVTIPLKIIFEESLKKGIFLDIWKKGNSIPAHKKEDKTLINNYRPISLLPIFGKIFERVI